MNGVSEYKEEEQLPTDSSGKPSWEQIYTYDSLRNWKLDEEQQASSVLDIWIGHGNAFKKVTLPNNIT